MPMELRKRKAAVNPPPPAPAKRTKSTKSVGKKAVASKAKGAAASAKKAAEKAVAKVVEKKKDDSKVAEEKAEEKDKPEEKSVEKKAEEKSEQNSNAPAEKPAEPEAAPAKKGKGKSAAKDAPAAVPDAKPAAPAAESKLKVGDALPSELPDVQLDDGKTANFNDLLEASEKGVVIFSYTKANTGGCTTQACAMRDNITVFTSSGWAVYGLSCDAPTANSSWKASKKLNYPLISDPSAAFHTKLGINKGNKGSRSVVVIQKEGRIVKEIKTVTPTNSLEVAKKAAGVSAAPPNNTTAAKKDMVANKTKEAAAAAAAAPSAPAAADTEAAAA